jgi:ATP-dependent Clp protease ATP-binding subunit ClpA
MDKATLTLGDNRVVNFSQTLLIMTSNLGAAEMNGLYTGGIGIRPQQAIVTPEKIQNIALQAAKSKFTPEFMNRIDKTVVFNTLTEGDMETILNLELARVSVMLVESSTTNFYLTPEAKAKVFSEGYSKEYGARNMKRTIEKRVTIPMSRLLSSNQVTAGETVIISEVGAEEFEYSVEGRVE